jgi:hypothetical protein
VLGQRCVDDKSNEITAIPELLDRLALSVAGANPSASSRSCWQAKAVGCPVTCTGYPLQDEPEGVWLTYAELAKARGIDKASAAKLVLRRRWHRQKDNRGTVRILVPPEWADPSRDPPQDVSLDLSPDMSGTINALEAELATVREALARELGRAARAEAEADRERDRAEAALVQATAAQADLVRERDRAEGALIRAAASEAEVRALRETLAEARRPFWRRWLGT